MFYQLKITLRNLRRGGIYSAINIGGLANRRDERFAP